MKQEEKEVVKQNKLFSSSKIEYNKAWKNKNVFPYLIKNKKEIIKDMEKFGIKRTILFDEIGEKWENWNSYGQITLSILPICNIINQNGNETKEKIKVLGFKSKKIYYPIDLETNEFFTDTALVTYFPTKNLVISKINPFVDKEMYQKFLEYLEFAEIEFKTTDEIDCFILERQWLEKVDQNLSVAVKRIEDLESDIDALRKSYFESIKSLKKEKETIENIKSKKENLMEHINKEIGKIKELPIIEKIVIKDKIYISFGNIFIKGKVETGKKEEDGIMIPIIEEKEVFIGKVTFIISSGDIIVENKTKELDYPHPHANNERICFGEADLEIKRLIASFELEKTVKLLFSWVFSYNENDAYTKLQTFYDFNKENKRFGGVNENETK